MLSIADHVRADFAQLDAYELVGKPTSALLGVSKPAEAALKHVGISTVFDLGASWLFANARAASEADREGTASSRFGRAPTDWLQTDVQYGSLAEISALPVQALRGARSATSPAAPAIRISYRARRCARGSESTRPSGSTTARW